MLNDKVEVSIEYRLHCLDIEMTELQHELQGFKDLVVYRQMLRHDFKEIRENAGEPRTTFLFNTYW